MDQLKCCVMCGRDTRAKDGICSVCRKDTKFNHTEEIGRKQRQLTDNDSPFDTVENTYHGDTIRDDI